MHTGYIQIILSCVVIYLFVVIAIRVFGKKELAQLSVVDLVFILLISNSVQNAMVGSDSSLAGGIIAASALFITNYLFKFVLCRFPKIGRMIQGEPIILIYDGKLNHKHIEKAGISLDELKEVVREHGVMTFGEVNLAVLEIDGNISVISNDFQHRTKKKRKGYKTARNDN